jgi:hypothetical protein
VLTDTAGYDVSNLAPADPGFVLSYLNTLSTATVLDEGGNAINVSYPELSFDLGNYHIPGGSPAVDAGSLNYQAAIPQLAFDFDGQLRPMGPGVDIGADEVDFGQVAVLSPSGGSYLPSGTIYPIIWGGISTAARYRLHYTTDNGATWIFIADVTSGTSYNWSVPIVTTYTPARVRVTAFAGSGAVLSRTRSQVFAIVPFAVISPNGGEILTSSASYNVQWTPASGAASYRLHYSTTNGAPWIPVTTVAGTVTSYNWTVPTVAGSMPNSLFRVSAYDGTGALLYRARSFAPFIIQP